MDTRTPLLWSGVAAIILVSAYTAIVGLPPKRPSTVPDNAVFVAGEKTGWWQVCFATDQGATYCRVFSKSGNLLVNEEFLPYDGGPGPTSSDLVLDPKNRHSDVYRVALRSGRILLRKSMFAQSKEVISSLERAKR